MITYEMIRTWAQKMILDARRKSRATAKRHLHLVGEQFKSINLVRGVTPALYRHLHITRTAPKHKVKKLTSLVAECIYGCGRQVLKQNSICRKCSRKYYRELLKSKVRVAPRGAYHTRVRS